MLDVAAIRQIFAVENVALATFIVVALFVVRLWSGAPAMFGKWVEWRIAKEAAKAADWTRLRDEINRLWAECASLRQAVNECEAREAEWMRRAIKAEAAAAGRGEGLQEVAVLKSAQRIVDRKDQP